MSNYNIVMSTSESTVVAEYIPDYTRSVSYQSEAELEREFIAQLVAQADTAPAAMATPKATAGWRLLSSVKRKADSPQSLAGAAACTVAVRGRWEKKPPSPTTDPGVTKARRSRPLASS